MGQGGFQTGAGHRIGVAGDCAKEQGFGGVVSQEVVHGLEVGQHSGAVHVVGGGESAFGGVDEGDLGGFKIGTSSVGVQVAVVGGVVANGEGGEGIVGIGGGDGTIAVHGGSITGEIGEVQHLGAGERLYDRFRIGDLGVIDDFFVVEGVDVENGQDDGGNQEKTGGDAENKDEQLGTDGGFLGGVSGRRGAGVRGLENGVDAVCGGSG